MQHTRLVQRGLWRGWNGRWRHVLAPTLSSASLCRRARTSPNIWDSCEMLQYCAHLSHRWTGGWVTGLACSCHVHRMDPQLVGQVLQLRNLPMVLFSILLLDNDTISNHCHCQIVCDGYLRPDLGLGQPYFCGTSSLKYWHLDIQCTVGIFKRALHLYWHHTYVHQFSFVVSLY